jgi:WD40 repeat protein
MSSLLVAPLSPYRGLAPFGDSDLDALFFFGREREVEVIVANLLASRLTVLYGPSGVGKSSVLRAGVCRRLHEVAPGAEVHVRDRWIDDPHLPDVAGETYLILDQLEEYFLYHGSEGPLVRELPDLLDDPGANVLLAIREDALAKLDAFQARVPTVFANQLRLDELAPGAARTAIVGPLDRYNELADSGAGVTIEPELVDAVLAQVAVRQSDSSRVEAPYLQLVLERLWDEERAVGSHVLRLATLDRLGGAATVVREHLEHALRGLPARDADLAASALRFLVTPSRTKIAHTVDDLAGYTAAGSGELRTVLEQLSSQRILRTVAPSNGEGTRYEIFHDVLAEPVLEWRHEIEARAAVERERRRHRRLFLFAAAALLLAAAMAALAVFALAQRHDARRQASLARAGQAEAVKQARLAERSSAAARVAAAEAKRLQRLADASAQQARQSAARARASERVALQERAKAQQQRAIAQQQRAVAEQQRAVAQEQRAAAERQRAVAQEQRAAAERQKARAQAAAERAHASAVDAQRQARLARVGEYTARASADLAVDPVRSVRAALAAAALESSLRVEDALRSSLVALRVRGVLDAGGGAVTHALFSPDGSLVATGSEQGMLRIFATGSHRLVRSIDLGSSVVSLVFSPDGSRLTAATGRGVSVRDARSGAEVGSLRVPGTEAAVSGAGGTVVTGGSDKTLRIWNLSSGAPIHSVSVPTPIDSIAASPNGELAAVFARSAATVEVVDVRVGAVVATLRQQGNVTAAAFSPDGALLVTSGHRNVYAWNASDWSLRHTLTGHSAVITSVAFARDGRLVTTSEDSSARLWDPVAGSLLFILAGQHEQKILAAAFGPDGTSVATASADGTARIASDPLGQVPLVLAGHTRAVIGVAFSPDGQLVLTASADGTARLWSARPPALRQVGALGGSIAAAAFSPDGKLVVAASTDGTARLWHAGGGVVATLRHSGKVTAASFVDGGSHVLTASEDGIARLWTTAGTLVRTFVHGAPVRAAFGEPGGDVVTAGDDGVVRLWAPSGRLLWSRSDGARVTAAAGAPDGTVVATGDVSGTVRLLSVRDGALLHVLRGHHGAVTSLDFAPDGTLLVSGSADGTARVWVAATGRLRHVLESGAALTSAVFSPDGALVLTADADGNVRTWGTGSGKLEHDLRFHVSVVSRASFSPDGRWVVTAGPSAAGLWQTSTGKLLYALRGSSGPLTTASFAPRGFTVLTGGSDGSVRRYACSVCGDVSSLEALARARLARLGRQP